MTFKAWLVVQKSRQDPVGALARDVLQDRAWPPTQDMGKMRQHMVKRGAVKDTLQALESAYAEYQKQGDRQRPSGIG